MYMSSNPALLAVLAGMPSALAATFTGRPSDETSRHSSLLDAAKTGCVRTRSSAAFRQAKSHKRAQSRLVDVLEPLPRPIVFAGGKIRYPPNQVSRRICEKVLFPVACAIHHAQYTISGTASATGVYIHRCRLARGGKKRGNRPPSFELVVYCATCCCNRSKP